MQNARLRTSATSEGQESWTARVQAGLAAAALSASIIAFGD